jgi:hypothetical protein
MLASVHPDSLIRTAASEGRWSVIHQLWGSLFDLVGDGGYTAWTFSWFFLKIGNVIEMILVVVIFVVGMFVNLPGGTVETPGNQR